ncbi:methyltransferase domain-containing protein [Pseudoalteromonas xiamenensis]|uniref:methyltransferase domain-containing protein n=1 Tax=Pseudoalteromonas xiamenensis TaxID=882626 RepID=UPI0027E4F006|nr:methyltransferase domain-containing protein [Pseudoalteromonas xiamenensis]WMN60079.1 methyltransferase domain-containing protein [Pseudoalteromonas xiamenensis]
MNAINKSMTAKKFSKAAAFYEEHAKVQAKSAQILFEWIGSEKRRCALDLGCGPGLHYSTLSAVSNLVVQLDLSESMLASSEGIHKVCADMDALPFQQNVFDLVFSNFAMQWSQDLNALLTNLASVLKPRGEAYLSVVLEGSLSEVKQAYLDSNLKSNVNKFTHIETLKRYIKSSSLKLQTIEQVSLKDVFMTPKEALQSIKKIGANHTLVPKQACVGLGGKSKILSILSNYPCKNGIYEVTYEVALLKLTKG